MGYRFNVFTGTLDIVDGGVTRVGSTVDKSIPRWVGASQNKIDGSKALIQDSGAIESQGYITNRVVTNTVTVNNNQSWISPSLEIAPGGIIVLSANSQLIIV